MSTRPYKGLKVEGRVRHIDADGGVWLDVPGWPEGAVMPAEDLSRWPSPGDRVKGIVQGRLDDGVVLVQSASAKLGTDRVAGTGTSPNWAQRAQEEASMVSKHFPRVNVTKTFKDWARGSDTNILGELRSIEDFEAFERLSGSGQTRPEIVWRSGAPPTSSEADLAWDDWLHNRHSRQRLPAGLQHIYALSDFGDRPSATPEGAGGTTALVLGLAGVAALGVGIALAVGGKKGSPPASASTTNAFMPAGAAPRPASASATAPAPARAPAAPRPPATYQAPPPVRVAAPAAPAPGPVPGPAPAPMPGPAPGPSASVPKLAPGTVVGHGVVVGDGTSGNKADPNVYVTSVTSTPEDSPGTQADVEPAGGGVLSSVGTIISDIFGGDGGTGSGSSSG